MENARLSYLESIDWDNEIMIVKASRQEDDLMLLNLLAPKASPLARLTPKFLQLR